MQLKGCAVYGCKCHEADIALTPTLARNTQARRPLQRCWPQGSCTPFAVHPHHADREETYCSFSGAFLAACLLLASPAAASNLTLRPRSLDVNPSARGADPGATRAPSVPEQVAAIGALTSKARAAADAGNFAEALADYTSITQGYPGLALTERARVKRALLLYETGQVQQAIVELDDEEIVLRGNAEVHAALATILYSERPDERQRAEAQWEVASEFDKRYGDVRWVAEEKQWGPRMQQALQRFLALE